VEKRSFYSRDDVAAVGTIAEVFVASERSEKVREAVTFE
jgi:hypothetical protein